MTQAHEIVILIFTRDAYDKSAHKDLSDPGSLLMLVVILRCLGCGPTLSGAQRHIRTQPSQPQSVYACQLSSVGRVVYQENSLRSGTTWKA